MFTTPNHRNLADADVEPWRTRRGKLDLRERAREIDRDGRKNVGDGRRQDVRCRRKRRKKEEGRRGVTSRTEEKKLLELLDGLFQGALRIHREKRRRWSTVISEGALGALSAFPFTTGQHKEIATRSFIPSTCLFGHSGLTQII